MKNTWRFSGNELKYLEVIDSGFGSGTSGSITIGSSLFKKVGAKRNNIQFGYIHLSGLFVDVLRR